MKPQRKINTYSTSRRCWYPDNRISSHLVGTLKTSQFSIPAQRIAQHYQATIKYTATRSAFFLSGIPCGCFRNIGKHSQLIVACYLNNHCNPAPAVEFIMPQVLSPFPFCPQGNYLQPQLPRPSNLDPTPKPQHPRTTTLQPDAQAIFFLRVILYISFPFLLNYRELGF